MWREINFLYYYNRVGWLPGFFITCYRTGELTLANAQYSEFGWDKNWRHV